MFQGIDDVDRLSLAANEFTKEDTAIKQVINGLDLHSVGVVGGSGGAGKSFFILDFCVKYVLGKKHPLTNVKVEDRKKILYISNEEAMSSLKIRIQRILSQIYNVPNWENDENSFNHWVDKLSRDKILNDLDNNFDILRINDLNKLRQLEAIMQTDKYDLIVFDTLSSLFQLKNENDNSEVSDIVNRLKKLAHDKDCAILVIHHLSQDGMKMKNIKEIEHLNSAYIRGATAFVNNTRYVAIFGVFDEKSSYYKIVKANNTKLQTYSLLGQVYLNGVKFLDKNEWDIPIKTKNSGFQHG